MNDLSEKSDEWLVEVLKGEDQEARNMAMQILQDRYQSRLRGYLRRKLPDDWNDDVFQETWTAFYESINRHKIEDGVPNYLFGIARNKRADAVDRLVAERNIEFDLPPTAHLSQDNRATVERPIEELIDEKEKQQFINQIPRIDNLLSDCERLVWILREEFVYPLPIIARLLGRRQQTIYSALFSARKRVKKYLFDDDHHLKIALRGQLRKSGVSRVLNNKGSLDFHKNILIVEWPSNPIPPQLTPDELKPLGLTLESVRSEYVATINIFNWYQKEEERSNALFLALVKRDEWRLFQRWMQTLSRNPQSLRDKLTEIVLEDTELTRLEFIVTFGLDPKRLVELENIAELAPRVHLFPITLDGENLILRPGIRVVCVIPDVFPDEYREEWGLLPPKDFVRVHNPRLMVPMVHYDYTSWRNELHEIVDEINGTKTNPPIFLDLF